MEPRHTPASTPAVPATAPSTPDQDQGKGAIEEDRPGPPRSSHPGLDENGLPNDAKAIAEDAVGARADDSQG